jgi:hypothetical protein
VREVDNHRLTESVLIALSVLQFENHDVFWGALRWLNAQVADLLFQIIGAFPVDEIRENFNLILPALHQNTDVRLASISHAITGELATLEGWEEVTTAVCEQSLDVRRRFIDILMDFDEFETIVHSVVMSEQMLNVDVLSILEKLRIQQDDAYPLCVLLNKCLGKKMRDEVERISQLLKGLDFAEVDVDLDGLFTFLKTEQPGKELIAVIEEMCQQNKEFAAVLRDEVNVALGRKEDAANLMFLSVRLFAKGIKDGVQTFRKAALNFENLETTADLLFPLFVERGYRPLEITQELFAISPLHSKCEKGLFREGLKQMDDQVFNTFLGKFVNSVNLVNPKPIDFKRVKFLAKEKPRLRTQIIRKSGLSKGKSLIVAQNSEEVARYAIKLFELTDDEIAQITPRPG